MQVLEPSADCFPFYDQFISSFYREQDCFILLRVDSVHSLAFSKAGHFLSRFPLSPREEGSQVVVTECARSLTEGNHLLAILRA